jgi:hypothetical protein
MLSVVHFCNTVQVLILNYDENEVRDRMYYMLDVGRARHEEVRHASALTIQMWWRSVAPSRK